MIVCHQHKFIFIKTKKTAGTSLEIGLSKLCGPGDIITPINPEDEIARREYAGISAQNYQVPLGKYQRRDWIESVLRRKRLQFYNHMPCTRVKKFLDPEVWNEYFKFTIERNPFDKLVSLFFWRNQGEDPAAFADFIQRGGLADFQSFDIYSIGGLVAVDQVYRFEDFPGLCSDLSERLNLAEPFSMPGYKAKSTSRPRRDYRDFYDEETKDQVSIAFARELALMGYQF